MSNQNDDGHSADCTFRKCAHPESPLVCPFVRDIPAHGDSRAPGTAPKNLAEMYDSPPCKHEWRLLGPTNGRPDFYCVFCLTVSKGN